MKQQPQPAKERIGSKPLLEASAPSQGGHLVNMFSHNSVCRRDCGCSRVEPRGETASQEPRLAIRTQGTSGLSGCPQCDGLLAVSLFRALSCFSLLTAASALQMRKLRSEATEVIYPSPMAGVIRAPE
ncbi:uncharacterized protein RBU33_021677 [Hipposideros larvatus]